MHDVAGSPIDFTGEVAVVTGSGRGLGRLYALDLASRGASVVVNDTGTSMAGDGVDELVADFVVEEIRAAGGTAVASHHSVADPEGGRAIVDRALDTFGRLDAVVNNAGIFHTAPFDEIRLDQWRAMIDVHLHGTFHVTQPAYEAMKERDGGRFVFVSSSAGFFGQPNSAHYAAAKSGILGLANVVAIEGEEHGILANSVLPFGSSRMVDETVGDDVEAVAPFVDAIRPELVVPLVTFLASRSCPVTHHAFSACAGRFARVFAALAEGWLDVHSPTAEDVGEHFVDVTADEPYTIPSSIFDEVADIIARLELTF